jgi:stage V sporulation protein G
MKNHLRAGFCNQCGAKLEDGRAPKDADGRAKLYADIAHPINSDCREMIQQRVIQEFFNEIELSKQPGYVSRYDDFDFEYANEAPRSKPARYDAAHGQSGPTSSRHHPPSGANVGGVRSADQSVRPADRTPRPRENPPQRPSGRPPENNSGKGEGFGAGIFPE